jgi:peptidyl-prolyl cis-trans isomerase C
MMICDGIAAARMRLAMTVWRRGIATRPVAARNDACLSSRGLEGRGDLRGLPRGLWPLAMTVLVVMAHFSLLWAAEQVDVGLKTVAKVNGVAISQREVNEATEALIPQASYHRNVSPEKMKELQKQALDNLVKEELFFRAGLKKGMKVAKQDINKRFDEIRKKYPSKSAFAEALKKYGVTEADIRKKIDHIMLADLFLKEEVYKKAELKDKELLDYYQKNQEKFQKPEAARISHILIKVPPEASKEEKEKLKKKAEDILQKLKKGDDFYKLAWDNSDDPSRVKGGDLGVVHRGRLEADVENAAFALKKGELSGIVTSIYGHHILKLVEKMPPQQLKFEETRDKLKKELEQKEVEKRLTNLVKNLKENAKIEIFTE